MEDREMLRDFSQQMYCLSQFFFFQAEDGIRDYKVTGVQTCALPIYRGGICCCAAAGSPPGGCGSCRLQVTAGYPSAQDRASRSRWRRPGTRQRRARARNARTRAKIGRESCRGRVVISVVAVSFKKKK